MGWRAWLWVMALIFMTGSADATGQGTTAIQKWKGMDNCAKQAQAAFPDFSPASNAKREAALKSCLDRNNYPPRAPATPAR
jgi:hypothetical protein